MCRWVFDTADAGIVALVETAACPAGIGSYCERYIAFGLEVYAGHAAVAANQTVPYPQVAAELGFRV